MRSTRIKIGVACAVSGMVALVLVALATTGAGAAGPVGSGTASATKSVCGKGTGKKATGSADQARRDRHADPGRRLHDDRQGRRRRTSSASTTTAASTATRSATRSTTSSSTRRSRRAREEADRERQGRRHRRQHELHRVRHQLEVLQVQGLHRDRRRRPGRVLRHADLRRVEHGPALQQHRCRPGARPRGREVARSSPRPTRSRRTPTVACSRSPRRRASRARASRPSSRSRTRTRPSCKLVQAAGAGRRRDPRLHARLGAGAHEGGDRPGPRRQGEVGLVDADRQRRSWRGSSREFDGKMYINEEFGLLDASQGPDTRLMLQILAKYAPSIAPAGVRPDGLHGRRSSRRRRC